MTGPAEFTIPVKTQGNNAREHWRVRAKRVNREKGIAAVIIKVALDRKLVVLPCVVRLTRLSAGILDDDNLRGACKNLRDVIADFLGVDDGDTSQVRYQYAQERCRAKLYGIKVTILNRSKLVETVRAARGKKP